MPLRLLEPQTASGNSEEFRIVGEDRSPATFTCPDLAGSETGTLQKKNCDETFNDSYKDGVKQEITATHTEVTVYGRGVYRVSKSATAATVGVEVSTDENP